MAFTVGQLTATKSEAWDWGTTGGGYYFDNIFTAIDNIVNPDAPVAKTGQTTSHATGDDGDLQKGITWPNPRFTDNGDGTIRDNLTCLIWTADANLNNGQATWANALAFCNGLSDATSVLTDSSVAGDWRLPNVRELQSLTHYGVFDPAVPNTAGTGKWSEGDPFDNVQSTFYWSSTPGAGDTDSAWYVFFHHGVVNGNFKTFDSYVWCVRGGS